MSTAITADDRRIERLEDAEPVVVTDLKTLCRLLGAATLHVERLLEHVTPGSEHERMNRRILALCHELTVTACEDFRVHLRDTL